MKKRVGFNFIEMLLVMLILGIIITLTIPLIKNIKDDKDIYRAYMRKANQDVTDALAMSLIKKRYFTGLAMLGLVDDFNGGGGYTADAKGIRYAFNIAISGTECNKDSLGADLDPKCLEKPFKNISNTDISKSAPGIILGGKSVMLFEYIDSPAADDTGETRYGYVYMDMNREKGPNEYCKDRYRFVLYNDQVFMDPAAGCTIEL